MPLQKKWLWFFTNYKQVAHIKSLSIKDYPVLAFQHCSATLAVLSRTHTQSIPYHGVSHVFMQGWPLPQSSLPFPHDFPRLLYQLPGESMSIEHGWHMACGKSEALKHLSPGRGREKKKNSSETPEVKVLTKPNLFRKETYRWSLVFLHLNFWSLALRVCFKLFSFRWIMYKEKMVVGFFFLKKKRVMIKITEVKAPLSNRLRKQSASEKEKGNGLQEGERLLRITTGSTGFNFLRQFSETKGLLKNDSDPKIAIHPQIH